VADVNKKVQNLSLAIKTNLIYGARMDRKTLMDEVAKTAFDRRIELSALFRAANVSGAIIHRYRKLGIPPTLGTIGKLEKALAEMSR
jgi:hypothetical protein